MDVIFVIIELILMIGLFVLIGIDGKRPLSKMRLLYLAPFLVAVLCATRMPGEWTLVGAYFGTVLVIGCLFVTKVLSKRILTVISAGLILVSFGLCMLSSTYRRADYLKGFEHGFSVMKEHYVLTEEKGIDWNQLYATYYPKFAEAEAKHDSVLNQKYWMQFAEEFHDGHVGFFNESDSRMIRNLLELMGNDYGLSFVRGSDGTFLAANVEGSEGCMSVLEPGKDYSDAEEYLSESVEEDRLTLWNAGLRNGCVITSWDGKSVEEVMGEVEVIMSNCPDLENDRFFRTMYAAGIGGESVTITFLDENGNEKSVTAPRLGAYLPRLASTMEKIDEGVMESNLGWRELSSDTVLLRIYSMSYDLETYDGADYTEMTDELREQVLALKESGYKNIIIDLRRNSGGSPFMVMGVAKLFAPLGHHVDCYSVVINEKTACFERGEDGKYVKDKALAYDGEDLWNHGRILLLVNGETVSAGDEMTYLMSQYPNVTIMGYTKSNSSCQAVTQVSVGEGALSFSAVPNIDENGDAFIDALADRKGRVPIDIVVPVDRDMVTEIFDRGEDHLLQEAMKELGDPIE